MPPTDCVSCDKGSLRLLRSVCTQRQRVQPPAVSAKHPWPPLWTELTEWVIQEEVPCISYYLHGICSGVYFLVYSSSQQGPLLHCLKRWHTKTAFQLIYCNCVPSPAVISRIFLSPLFCLMGPYIACWLDFSTFSIFGRNHTRKNTLESQSEKTGRSQVVLVVTASLQCHDNSQQLRASSTPLHHIKYYVTC